MVIIIQSEINCHRAVFCIRNCCA